LVDGAKLRQARKPVKKHVVAFSMRGARSEQALTAFHIIGRGISAKMLNFVFVKSKFVSLITIGL